MDWENWEADCVVNEKDLDPFKTTKQRSGKMVPFQKQLRQKRNKAFSFLRTSSLTILRHHQQVAYWSAQWKKNIYNDDYT